MGVGGNQMEGIETYLLYFPGIDRDDRIDKVLYTRGNASTVCGQGRTHREMR